VRVALLATFTLVAGGIVLTSPLAAQEDIGIDHRLSAVQLGGSSALDRINSYRAVAGVSPASAHPALMRSAAGHVVYYDLNRGDAALAGMGLHDQRAEAVGFTGITMGDRARAAGYASAAVTENAGFGGLDAAIDWHMNTVNHRLPLIHPNALDMGVAASDVSGFNVIQVGLRRDPASVTLPSVYPPDGAGGVPLLWDGAETPNPAPGIPRPLGYPITVAFGVNQRVEWRTIELRVADGDLMEVSTPRKDWMRAMAIIPHRPLEPGQLYTASVEAVVDGKLVSKTWSFTTG
jgi:Cysteine-rich secretory protein family